MALRRIQACIILYALFSRSPIVQCELHRPIRLRITRATRREMRKTRRRMRCERSAERVLALRLLFNTLRITCGCRGEQRSECWAKEEAKEERYLWDYRFAEWSGDRRHRSATRRCSESIVGEIAARRPECAVNAERRDRCEQRERETEESMFVEDKCCTRERNMPVVCLFTFVGFFSSFSFSFYISSTGKS